MVNDGKSSVEGELELREARLEFRGSKKEGSEVGSGVEMGGIVVGSKVGARELKESHFGDYLLCCVGVKAGDGEIRQQRAGGAF